jgi:hypothetical protein
MISGKSIRCILTSLLLIAVVSMAAFADTIRLKDGSIIKGRIIGFSNGRFTVVIGEGSRQRQLTFDAAEVESIEFDSDKPTSSPVRSSDNTERTPRPRFETVVSDGVSPRAANTPPVKADPPPVAPRPVPERVATTERSSASATPIEISVKVLADNTANGWTNSGWVVRKGQRIRIIGSGTVNLGGGNTTGPGGLPDLKDNDKLLAIAPTGALIAVIGDDNNDFIYIGTDREFTATRDGALFLGVNEGDLDDNAGAFDVKIQIFPDKNE